MNGKRQRVREQSPARELDGDFLRVPRKQVRAEPEREAEEEEFHRGHGDIVNGNLRPVRVHPHGYGRT